MATISCLAEIAKEASKLLNDSNDCNDQYNNTRWSINELVHYAKDGITMIWMMYPKKFTTVKNINLVKGKVQKLPEDCVKLTNVIGVNGEHTGISAAAMTDDRLSDLFRFECNTDPLSNGKDNKYHLKSWSVEETSDNIFYVTPPVEDGQVVKLDVICSEAPDIQDEYCPERWMHNLIIEWMLYRAYSSEDESTYSQENSTMHLNHFYSMLSNFQNAENMLVDKTMKSGNANASAAPN